MATIITHPIIAIGLCRAIRDLPNWKLILFTGAILTILPDIDVIGFRLGIPYEHILGHRGITHSIFFSVLASLLASVFFLRVLDRKFLLLWAYLFLSIASHGLLDALTNGGKGIAFFAPFNNERYFFPFRPLEVSTINLSRFISSHGINVLKSEIIWVWLPAVFIFLIMYKIKVLFKNSSQ
jgi:inner membrane protein